MSQAFKTKIQVTLISTMLDILIYIIKKIIKNVYSYIFVLKWVSTDKFGIRKALT